MALSHKLELRQSQSLVMTPQLMQAIKLLQLSNLDLIAYVDAELERNPLLERGEAEDGGEAEQQRVVVFRNALAGERFRGGDECVYVLGRPFMGLLRLVALRSVVVGEDIEWV